MNSPYASGQQAEPNSSWFNISLCGRRGGVGADLILTPSRRVTGGIDDDLLARVHSEIRFHPCAEVSLI
jgi:hypothetical protein